MAYNTNLEVLCTFLHMNKKPNNLIDVFLHFLHMNKKAQQLGVFYPGNLVLNILYSQWNLTNVMRICLYVSLRFIEQTLDVICSPHFV